MRRPMTASPRRGGAIASLTAQLLAFSAMVSTNAEAGSLIPGFRGMDWGDPVTKLGPSEPIANTTGCFLRKSEKPTLNDIPLTDVHYCFSDGKLTFVLVRTHGSFKAVRAAVVGAYGKPRQEVAGYAIWGDSEERNGGTASLVGKQDVQLTVHSNQERIDSELKKIIKARQDF